MLLFEHYYFRKLFWLSIDYEHIFMKVELAIQVALSVLDSSFKNVDINCRNVMVEFKVEVLLAALHVSVNVYLLLY